MATATVTPTAEVNTGAPSTPVTLTPPATGPAKRELRRGRALVLGLFPAEATNGEPTIAGDMVIVTFRLNG